MDKRFNDLQKTPDEMKADNAQTKTDINHILPMASLDSDL
jgi:hypothetical protein